MTRREFCCKTEQDTLALGGRLAKELFVPSFVALYGDLGAGKTAFTRGMGLALGTDEVASPTFLIVQEHDTRPKLLHFDVYRLSDEDALYDIGYEDYLKQDAVVVMEWAELVPGALPPERLDVDITLRAGEERAVAFTARGRRYEELIKAL